MLDKNNNLTKIDKLSPDESCGSDFVVELKNLRVPANMKVTLFSDIRKNAINKYHNHYHSSNKKHRRTKSEAQVSDDKKKVSC